MRHQHIICALAALAFTVPALAAEPAGLSYTHVDVGYITVDAGGGSVDGLGATLDFAFAPAWYGTAGLADVDGNTTLMLGGGWHTGIAARTDLFVEAGLLSTDTGAGSDQGFIVGLGLRGMLSPAFELAGRVDMIDYGGGSDSRLAISGVYYLSQVGLFGEFQSDDSADAIIVGARIRF